MGAEVGEEVPAEERGGNGGGGGGGGGSIGEVCNVVSDFHFNASDSEDYPKSFFYDRKLGGGASMLVGPYPAAMSTLFFGGRGPSSDDGGGGIKVVGQTDATTGVDLQVLVALSYPASSPDAVPPAVDPSNATDERTPKLPGAGIACLTYGMLGESDETTKVVGTKGRITIHTPCHCPTAVTIERKSKGRGQTAGSVTYRYPLPPDTPEIERAGGYNYPNSAGFAYEAAAVARCIAAGKTECPQYTWDETLINARILDAARAQLGIKSIYEE